MTESAGALRVGARGMPLPASTLFPCAAIRVFGAGSVRDDQALPYPALFQGERQTDLFVSSWRARRRVQSWRATASSDRP